MNDKEIDYTVSITRQTIYQHRGYESRRHYLQCLAEDNGVPFQIVALMADLYGPGEDFDGLVTAVQDTVIG